MIQRRGFFGKMAGLFGLAALPLHRSQASVSTDLRLTFRDKKDEPTSHPDFVRIAYRWDIDDRGDPVLKCYLDCHGETYGRLITMDAFKAMLPINDVVVTPTHVCSLPGTTPRRS